MSPAEHDERPLHLPERMQRALLRASETIDRREACGLILGDPRTERAVLAVQMTNVATGAREFAFDPHEQMYAWLQPRDRQPLAIWHSHPGGSFAPSRVDEGCMRVHNSLAHIIVARGQLWAYRWSCAGAVPVTLREAS